jgi:hypothetical protein
MSRLRLLAAAALLASLPSSALAGSVLETYWPHEDGRQWLYDQHYEDLGPAPEVIDSQARLYFDGTTTAPIGIAAQMLKGSVASVPARAHRASDPPVEVTDPLLRNVWIARPDLRDQIVRTSVEQPCVSQGIAGWYPLLLTGDLAYVQTATQIGAWRCDLANTQAWLWLTSNLTPGHTEMLQLIPDLADDVILYVTVAGFENATVPAGSFVNCLHVDYRIDYGESECTSSTGDPLGTFRSETTGFVRYAPGVGPIESYEQFMQIQVTGDCGAGVPVGTPLGIGTLKLNAPSVPAHAASWGEVKAAYHR